MFTTSLFKKFSASHFPPKNSECFDRFMDVAQTGYADGFHIPQFNSSAVTAFRCASQLGFDQYEITATDTEGHSFYIHKDEGGMAASGADGVYDFCYIQDGKVIKSEKLIGHNPPEAGTCVWTDGFPSAPTSTYSFSK